MYQARVPEWGTHYAPNGGETSRWYEIGMQAYAREIFRQRLQPVCHCERSRSTIAPPAPLAATLGAFPRIAEQVGA